MKAVKQFPWFQVSATMIPKSIISNTPSIMILSKIDYGERNRSYEGVAQNQKCQGVLDADYFAKHHNGSFSAGKTLKSMKEYHFC